MTLNELNQLDADAFTRVLGGIFEHSPWIAAGAYSARPFASIEALHGAMCAVLAAADNDAKVALIRAHPELAGKAAIRGELTAESTGEQKGAGLDQCSPEEYAELHRLNADYGAKFGFPFILAVKGHDRQSVIANFRRRVAHDRTAEQAECLRQIERIGRFRLEALLA
jgi:2-oxo-4-hydroxy-4-carboxy-5-ureidoimidazoline decarboxylase